MNLKQGDSATPPTHSNNAYNTIDTTHNGNKDKLFVLESLRQKPPLPPRLMRVPVVDTNRTYTTLTTSAIASTTTTPYASSLYEEELIEAKQWIQDRIQFATATTTTTSTSTAQVVTAAEENSPNTTAPFTEQSSNSSHSAAPLRATPAAEVEDVIELTSSSHDSCNEGNSDDNKNAEDVVPLSFYTAGTQDDGPSATRKGEDEKANVALQIVADVTYHERLKLQCLSRWRERTENREEHRKHQTMLADHYYGHVLVYIFYRAWSWRYAQRRRCREKRREVEAFVQRTTQTRKETLKRDIFIAWRRLVLERQKRTKKAVRFNEQRVQYPLAQRHFRLWLAFSNRRGVAEALRRVSAEGCISSFFQKWNVFRLRRKEQYLKEMLVSLFTPPSWPQRIAERRKKNMNTVVLVDWRSLTLFSCFRRWLLCTFQSRKIRLQQQEQKLRYLTTKRHVADLSSSFRKWHQVTRSSRLWKEHCEVMRTRYFHKWLSVYTRERAAVLFRASHEAEWFRERVFSFWKQRAAQQARRRRQEQLADAFHKTYARLQFTARQAWVQWRQRAARRARYERMVQEASVVRQQLLQSLAWHRVVDGALTRTASPPPPSSPRHQLGRNTSGMTPPIPLDRQEVPQKKKEDEEDSGVGDMSLDHTDAHNKTQEMIDASAPATAILPAATTEDEKEGKNEPTEEKPAEPPVEVAAAAAPSEKEKKEEQPHAEQDVTNDHKESTSSVAGDGPPPPHYAFPPFPFPPPYLSHGGGGGGGAGGCTYPSPYPYPSPWYSASPYYPPPAAASLFWPPPPPTSYYGPPFPIAPLSLSLPPCPQPYSPSVSVAYPPPPPPPAPPAPPLAAAQTDRGTPLSRSPGTMPITTSNSTATTAAAYLYTKNNNKDHRTTLTSSFPFSLPSHVPPAAEMDGESEGDGFAVPAHARHPVRPQSRNLNRASTREDRETPSEEEMLFEGRILVQKYKQGKKKKQEYAEELRRLTNELIHLTHESDDVEGGPVAHEDVLSQMQALQERRHVLLACQREQEQVELQLKRFMAWLERHLSGGSGGGSGGGAGQRMNLSLDGMSSILDTSR